MNIVGEKESVTVIPANENSEHLHKRHETRLKYIHTKYTRVIACNLAILVKYFRAINPTVRRQFGNY